MSRVEVTFAEPPHSRRASEVPGDTLRELTRAATDTDGFRWPAGALYQPQSHGNQGVTVLVLTEVAS